MIRIALDVPGGDLSETERIKGALEALEHRSDLSIILVGHQVRISQIIAQLSSGFSGRIHYLHTEETIDMGESPSHILKQKKNSSLALSVNLVQEGKADAIVSAGNTGAQMAASLFTLGRISTIERPAIATTVPCMSGSFILLDAGANTDTKPQHLADFAEMGAVFAQKIYQKNKPKIGLLNNGTEEEKGSKLTKEALILMKKNPFFYGYIEGREMMQGLCDVVVCDGFTGNIALKTIEGVAQSMVGWLKKELSLSISHKFAALLLKSSLVRLKGILDYRTYGGAPLLGVKGISIICHGSSDALAIKNALFLAAKMHQEKLIDHLSAI